MKGYLLNPEKRRKLRLVLYDGLVVLCVFGVSYLFRITLYEGREISELIGRVSWLVFLATLVHLVSFYAFGLYEKEISTNRKVLFIYVTLSVLVASGGVAILSFVFRSYQIGRLLLGIHMPLMVAVIYLWRFFYGLGRGSTAEKKTILVGWDGISRRIADALKDGQGGYGIEGVVVGEHDVGSAEADISAAVYDSLESALGERMPDALVLSSIPGDLGVLRNFLLDLKFEGMEIYSGPKFYERISGRVLVREIQEGWLLLAGNGSSFQPAIYQHLKRLVDMAVSGVVLLASAPVWLLIGLLIRLDSMGPVLFRQKRLGQHERPFDLLKFRTMVEDAEKDSGPCWATEADPRFTRVGRFLRKTRLDEMPQFLNVLKGDMSLVGPRPIRAYFAEQFAEKFPYYRLRFKVRPGITGWAQVNMPYVKTEEEQYEKLEYEIFYIYHRSIFLDLFILLKTVQSVMRMRGG